MLARSTDSISIPTGTHKLCRCQETKVNALLWKILPDISALNKLAADFKLLQALLLSKTRTKDLWSAQGKLQWRAANASSLLVCIHHESLPSTTPIEAQCANQTRSIRETVPWNISKKMKTKTESHTRKWNRMSQVPKKPHSKLLLCSCRSLSTILQWFQTEISLWTTKDLFLQTHALLPTQIPILASIFLENWPLKFKDRISTWELTSLRTSTNTWETLS